MLKPLDRQSVLVTGATSGIGLVTARAFAAAGAKVLLVSRDDDALRKVAEGIRAKGGSAEWAVADVADPEALGVAADRAVAAFGGIDTWVNNAGTSIYAELVDTPLDEHRRLFETNYFGVVNGCMSAVARMRETGGAIITIGSIGSDLPEPAGGAYVASKHAVAGYVETLRMELQAAGVPISVTLIKPSGMDTPFAQRAAAHHEGEPNVPPPVYTPDLVARAVLHTAAHPRNTVVVGGGGRALMALRHWAPWVLDRATPLTLRLLFDRDREQSQSDALWTPVASGRERSGLDRGKNWSSYTAATLHPVRTLAIAAAVGGVGAYLVRRRHRTVRRSVSDD